MQRKQHSQPRKSAEDFQHIPAFEEPPESSLKDYLSIDEKQLIPGNSQDKVASLCQQAVALKAKKKLPDGQQYEDNPEYTRLNPIGKNDGLAAEDLALDASGNCTWTNSQLLVMNSLGDNPVIASCPDENAKGDFAIYIKKVKKQRPKQA